jgi:hypothetical protein
MIVGTIFTLFVVPVFYSFIAVQRQHEPAFAGHTPAPAIHGRPAREGFVAEGALS